jgi:GTP cyclohydrolase I
MEILIYHGKHGDEYWLADTPERLEAAMNELFARLDNWGCYEHDEENVAEARDGDIEATNRVLTRHRDYEYEGWELEEAVDPCTP